MPEGRKHTTVAPDREPSNHFGRRKASVSRLVCRGIITASLTWCVFLCGCRGGEQRRLGSGVEPEGQADKATLSLAQLRPAIAKPNNPPGVDELPEDILPAVVAAEKLLAGRKFALAIDQLAPVASLAGEYPRLARVLALAYAAMPDQAKAADALAKAAAMAPDDIEIQLATGRLHAAGQRNDSAILAFRTALLCSEASEDSPLAAEALLWLSDLLAKEGHYAAAAECVTQLGERIDKHGRMLAGRPLLRILVLRPEGLLTRHGELLAKLGRFHQAAEVLDAALGYDRSNRRTARLLVEALVAVGDFEKAVSVLVSIADQQDQLPQLGSLAETVCIASGRVDLPKRIADSIQARRQLDGPLAASLAETARKLGSPQEAEAICLSVLENRPASVAVVSYLAGLQASQGRHREALRLIARMLSEDPEASGAVRDSVAEVVAYQTPVDIDRTFALAISRDEYEGIKPFALLYVAGRLAELADNPTLAVDQYREVINADPGYIPAYEALVDIYIKTDRHSRIERLLRRAQLTTDQRGGFIDYLWGRYLLSQGNFTKAAEHLARARSQDGAHLMTLKLLGKTLMRLDRGQEAIEALSAAVRIAPEDEEIYRMLFQAYLARGEYLQARGLAAMLLRRNNESVTGKLFLVRLALLRGQVGQARRMINTLRAEGHDDPEIVLLATQISLAESKGPMPADKFQVMAELLAGIIVSDPAAPGPKRTLALLFDRQGGQADTEAAEIWGRLYRQTNRQTDVAKAYAAALYKVASFKRASEILRQVIAESPRHTASRQLLLRTLAKLGDEQGLADQCADGQKVLDEWIASVSDPKLIDSLRAKKMGLYALAGLYDQYADLADQWIRRQPTDQALRKLLIGQLVQADRPDFAHRMLEQWIESDLQQADTYRRMKMVLYVRSGQLEQAGQFAAEWARGQGDALLPRQIAVSILISGEHFAEAQELLDTWAEAPGPAAVTTTQATQPTTKPTVRPVIAWARQWAVRSLMARGQFDEALPRTERYISLGSHGHQMLMLKSSCLTELGREDEALAVMEAAYQLGPEEAGTNNNLGYMYAVAGVKLDQAERMIRVALAEMPKQVSYQDSLAWVFYKQGRFAEAGRIFERILSDPGDGESGHSVIYDHAGDTMWRLGRPEKALLLWRLAVQKGEKLKFRSTEVRRAMADAPAKIEAAKSGGQPEVAELGQGYESHVEMK